MPKFEAGNIVEVTNPVHKWFGVYIEVFKSDDEKQYIIASPIGLPIEPLAHKDVQFVAKDYDSVPTPEWE